LQKRYKKQVETLASELSRHFASHAEARSSGMIVNTCGWVDGEGYELLLHAIRAFKIDVVLVLDNERLFSDLKSTSFGVPVECIKLRKSGGVVARDSDTRRADRQRAVRFAEFLGGKSFQLCF
jgi:polyribonucleotide 5'-hydroxyl-kinase